MIEDPKFEDLDGVPRPDQALNPLPDVKHVPSYAKASESELQQLRLIMTNRKRTGYLPRETKDKAAPVQSQSANLVPADSGHTIEHDPNPKVFDNAVDWLNFAMPELKLHRWQFEMLMELSGYQNRQYNIKTDYTDKNPYMGCMVCANGSGKDMIINAGFCTYFVASARKNRVLLTSSSAEQLKRQTEVHIRDIAKAVNHKVCYKMFNSVEFFHSIPELGSDIQLLATDEAGRAEGFHPYYGGRFMIGVNEAKSIDLEIMQALSRCSGYSIWLNISSPGDPSGLFYNSFANGVQWPTIPREPGQYQVRRVTAFECPHISRATIDNIIAINGGVDSPIVQSSVFANFVAELADIIIPQSFWDYDMHRISGLRRAGLDVGGGVDETVLIVVNGNYIEGMETVVEADLAKQTDLIESWLRKYDLKNHTIWGDSNGLGQGVINNLQANGWKVRGIKFQSQAENPAEYSNLGAECWFNLRKFVQKKLIPKPADPELYQQLTHRYYKRKALGKFQLEDKDDHRKRNVGQSPNKADAFVQCWIGMKPQDFDWKPDKEPRTDLLIQPARMRTYDYWRQMQERNNPPKSMSLRSRLINVIGKN